MGDIYRDRSEGTAARRQELLRRRRDELVTMPHAVRRVVVARSARVAAGMMATAVGVALIVAASWPDLAARIAGVMPGLRPAPLATMLFAAWLLALIAWAISRARVEHRFAVAMSRFVLPSDDVDHDVERLDHERPDAIARAMGHALEVRSAAWPMLAAGVLIPATALWLAWTVRAGGWSIAELEDDLARHASVLAALGVVGAITAIALTRQAVRRPAVPAVALLVAAGAAGLAFVGFAQDTTVGWALAGLAAASIGVAATASVLKHERALLAIDDPAAGSEIFTLRGAMRAVRAKLTIARAALLRVKPRYAVMAASAGLISVGFGLAMRPRPAPTSDSRWPVPFIEMHATAPARAHVAAPPAAPPAPAADHLVPAAPPAPAAVPYTVRRAGGGFIVDATVALDGHLVVPMVGVPVVPHHWRATLYVHYWGGDPIAIVHDGETHGLDASRPATRISIEACDGPRPLELHLVHPGGAAAQVELYVRPELTVAACGD